MASLAQQRRALQAADELLNEFDIDQEVPVDVFELIDWLGLWLVFNPLNSLLGAVVPKGSGGIMLTTQRGPTVQRYTAAHEIGHWVLDVDEPAFDNEGDIFEPSVDRERLAQLFAGHLLMPPPLVFATCARHGITASDEATGPRVYLAARDMGASYEAAVRQLANLDIIDPGRRDNLLSLTPQRIKTELCMGHRPTGWVDVWPVDFGSTNSHIQVTTGDELFVALPENRTTGYRWLTSEEMQRRATREPAPAPAPITTEHSDASLRGSHPTSVSRKRTHAEINRALARVPGNAARKRVLPADERGPGIELPSALSGRPDVPPGEPVEAGLLRVDDRFQAGWARLAPATVRTVRRTIAGRSDTTLPETVDPYRSQADAPAAAALEPSAIPIGATGRRLLALRSVGEGAYSLDLSYTSAHDPRAATAGLYHLDVIITSPPQVQNARHLRDVDLGDADGDPDGTDHW